MESDMTSSALRSGLLLLALVPPWAGAAGAQPAASTPGGQQEAQSVQQAKSKSTIEAFGNVEYTSAAWAGLFGDAVSGFGGNGGVRVYPSPKSRHGFGFRFSRFGADGTSGSGFSSDTAPIDASAWTLFADWYLRTQSERAQVFFFLGAGIGEAVHAHHYPNGSTVKHYNQPGSFFAMDIGVGLKVPVTRRLALGPEFRSILGSRAEWFSLSIGVGITFTVRR
jgi:hypothetical protein